MTRMNKVILVTGANRGIGLETARQLAARGHTVYLGCRDVTAGRDAAESFKGEVEVLQIDVSSPDGVRAAFKEFTAKENHLDVLVNNAGVIHDGDDDITTMDPALIERTMRTNTFGALRASQAFLPLLRKSKLPRIINISSGGGQLSDGLETWAPAYCISKTALNGVTVQLAAALPDFSVNSVCPGWVRTDMGGSSAPRNVQEGADTVVWLATEAPQELTGKFLRDRKELPW
jgi:NAD(P)-dependent dehydrogenase (short-subunit alcohol dehydrogenase family)